MAKASHHFPPGFLWGTATSAHQVEGGNSNNNWHAFEQERIGRVHADQVSGDACGWWGGQAEADIGRMAELNTNAHRLSIEWSRIEPEPGKWDYDALDRYRSWLKLMGEAGIQPMVTLHHFTDPLWVTEQGGWLNPETVALFKGFVRKAVGELYPYCDTWCTINEPNVYAAQGYFQGVFPPGHTKMREYFEVVHNLLHAHAAAYEEIHAIQSGAKVGLAKHMVAWYPRHANNPLDTTITRLLDRAFNGITLDALATGAWHPLIGKKAQLDKVAGTLDWIGLNYYQRYDAAFDLRNIQNLGISFGARPKSPSGPDAWGEFYPDGILEQLRRLNRQFHLPIYITENGLPDEFDSQRPAFMLEHLRQIWKAAMFSLPIQGYYFWSLVDNFEWAEGYDLRFSFGLYDVDFETQERTLRASGKLYAEIAESNSINSDMVSRYAPHILDTMFPGGGPDDLKIAKTRAVK